MSNPLEKQNAFIFILAAAAAIAPTLAVVAPLGMAPLFILVSVAGIFRYATLKTRPKPGALAAAFFLAIPAYGLISVAWALDRPQTFKTALVLGLEFAAGLLLLALVSALGDRDRFRIARASVFGVCAAIALLLIEIFTPGIVVPIRSLDSGFHPVDMLNQYSRGVTVAAVLLVPSILFLWRNISRPAAAALAVGGLVVVANSLSLASKLALPIAAAAAAMFYLRPRIVSILAAAAGILFIFAAFPAALSLPGGQAVYDAAPWLSPSAHHRLTIWRFSARNTQEKPLLGWGLDASRVIPGADDEVMYRLRAGDELVSVPEAQLPLHPHSAPIQIWLELGLAGVVLTSAALALVFFRIGGKPPFAAATAGATCVAALIVSSVSYGIWQSWWQGTLWLAASLIVSMFPQSSVSATKPPDQTDRLPT